MFLLQLNPIKNQGLDVAVVARSENAEALISFMEREKVPEYRSQDGLYGKVFRAGGPLEWFNPPTGEAMANGVPYIMDIGTADSWAEQAKRDFEEKIMGLPTPEMLVPQSVQL